MAKRGVYAVKNIIDHEKSDIKLDLSTIKFWIIPSVWSPEQFQNLVFFQKLAVQNAPSGSLGNHMQVLGGLYTMHVLLMLFYFCSSQGDK